MITGSADEVGATEEPRPGNANLSVPQMRNHHQVRAYETNVAKIVEVNKLKNTLKEYLFDGMSKSLKRHQEKDQGWVRFTDTVRLHLAYHQGDDFKLEVWLCSFSGRAISKERERNVEGLRIMLGDYLFEAMKASNRRRVEESMGMSEHTSAVAVSFPKGDDGSDCTVEVMLSFEAGLSVWAQIYPR